MMMMMMMMVVVEGGRGDQQHSTSKDQQPHPLPQKGRNEWDFIETSHFTNPNMTFGNVTRARSRAARNMEDPVSRNAFLELVGVEASAIEMIEALTLEEVDEMNLIDDLDILLISSLVDKAFDAHAIVNYKLRSIAAANSIPFSEDWIFYLDDKGRLVHREIEAHPFDGELQNALVVIGNPCLIGTEDGHIPIFLITIPSYIVPSVIITQEVRGVWSRTLDNEGKRLRSDNNEV
ncbi:hypothetical protein Pcinc_023427 [Petrolisthes cinctipes]|uniref:Uncharacterized protein n=1 Tax=Petrolisthes cinctipes TaxID=88211 RepID=A0AAE1FEF2_PETCI|nr:hypothetical protein Pcinc_023427 [Petrolisthes cinctipes]